ncbi:MAG TPA: hypothetical protein VFE18_16055 [Phenylobacterium sp.]|jgi:hypothetical protein|uniref:hypothetical protein n=1 Tax=Phenylobacterium sp. TaxID=1871053 RepID=UPI002D58C142|nr:hypothetical protein [Phenylobacterium sp.]HZZ69686.1 hypothetical protein [Phenylobacterium sp.]
MILALLAAATVAAPPPKTEIMPNLYRQPAYCGPIVRGELARQQVAFDGHPPAAEYALYRTLDGCSMPTPVGYHPSYPPPSSAPAPRREDAPSNRR